MTILAIKDFYELGLPYNGLHGWSTCGKSGITGMYYLLNDDRLALCDLDNLKFEEIKENLYFKTKWHCHREASEYYSKHGKAYPYMTEWANCSWDALEQLETVEDNDSQVMDFI